MPLKNLSQAIKLFGKMDLDKLVDLSEKVDVGRLLGAVTEMDAASLETLMHAMEQRTEDAKELPPPNGDFFSLRATLTDGQRELQDRVRAFMEAEVAPLIAEHWADEAFPREIIPTMRRLDLLDAIWTSDGSRRPGAALTEGIAIMEMARVDPSVAAFLSIQTGLAMMSLFIGGDDAQRRHWLPRMKRLEVLGAFALTEPEVGSGVARGLRTTCRLDGDAWVLDGVKHWIGNATLADVVIVWAKSEHDGQVKGFLVPSDSPGFQARKITGKVALRALENASVVLEGCRVPESHRLQRADTFQTAGEVLGTTRTGVAWLAVGAATGAYERGLAHAQEREQFGRPIAGFQLVQEHLVQMLAEVTAMQHLCLRLARMQDEGIMRDEHASLAKLFAAEGCRKVAGLARGLLGADGLLVENEVARFFADAEAIYGFEGTHEINTLVVGRAVTGVGAFA